ncbi:SLBB domain-containing protein [Methylotenera sp.]|uniref:SLBB domain-containing protein n=1 Tax=Methylotenera sp. TaxID=2051956 RepID=UPI0024889108|nr:SLBB domain-containing protein [Methylotenera sp.]MDI1360981.1 SLBB domain-containing protein [Methylotenera sp.]
MKLRFLRFITLIGLFLTIMSFSNLARADGKPDYLLGVGDSIRISVFQNPELMTETRVSGTGLVTYPLIGEVKVGGKSIQAAEQLIAQALIKGGYVKEPQVNIVLLLVRGNQVAVLGMVNRPGRYPLETSDIPLSHVVATAGGVSINAGNGMALLLGTRDGQPYKYEVDLATLFLGDKKAQDILVSNGDVIYITPGNQVSIIGQVLRPGRFSLDGVKMRLVDALALAGGMIPTASDSVVVTGMHDGQPFKKEFDVAGLFLSSETTEDMYVFANDQIYVHRAPVYYIYGEVQRPSSYRVERDMTVVQALAQGGGPTVRGTQRNIKLMRRNDAGVVEKVVPKLTDLIKANDVLYVEESLF